MIQTLIPAVIQADIELFLCGYLRAALADSDLVARYPILAGFEIDNREPTVSVFPDKLVIVRLDSLTRTSLTTADAVIGVSTLLGGVTDISGPGLAARVVHALVESCAGTASDNPVSAVTESNGPYAIPEDQPRARLYSTFTLSVSGTSL